MLTSLKVEGYRKFKDITINDFGRINFILGNNNIGKTTVLESIYIWACGHNVVAIVNFPLNRGRYYGMHPYWMVEEVMALVNDRNSYPLSMSFSGVFNDKPESFFHTIYPSSLLAYYDSRYKNAGNFNVFQFDSGLQEENKSNDLSQQRKAYQSHQWQEIAKWIVKHNDSETLESVTYPSSSVSENNVFKPVVWLDVLSHTNVSMMMQIYSDLKRGKRMDGLVKELSEVYPDIAGFDLVPYPDGSLAPVSVIKRDGSLLPIYAFGDGVQRWFFLLGAMELYKNSIICIDEIDTGFHPGAQVEFNKHLAQYARKNNVQLFITTHNIEFVDHFLDGVSELGDDYAKEARVITMREINKDIRFRTMSAVDAKRARNDYKAELR